MKLHEFSYQTRMFTLLRGTPALWDDCPMRCETISSGRRSLSHRGLFTKWKTLRGITYELLTNEPFNQSPTQLFYCSNAQLSAFAPLHLSRVLYKSTLFMQNKPNFRKARMDVSLAITRNYNNEQRTMNNELLFKTNPNKPNFRDMTLANTHPPKHCGCRYPALAFHPRFCIVND